MGAGCFGGMVVIFIIIRIVPVKMAVFIRTDSRLSVIVVVIAVGW